MLEDAIVKLSGSRFNLIKESDRERLAERLGFAMDKAGATPKTAAEALYASGWSWGEDQEGAGGIRMSCSTRAGRCSVFLCESGDIWVWGPKRQLTVSKAYKRRMKSAEEEARRARIRKKNVPSWSGISSSRLAWSQTGFASCLSRSEVLMTAQGPMTASAILEAVSEGEEVGIISEDVHGKGEVYNPFAMAASTRGEAVALVFEGGRKVCLTTGHMLPLGEQWVEPDWSERAAHARQQEIIAAGDVEPGMVLADGEVKAVAPLGVIGAVRLATAHPAWLNTQSGLRVGSRWHEVMHAWTPTEEESWGPSEYERRTVRSGSPVGWIRMRASRRGGFTEWEGECPFGYVDALTRKPLRRIGGRGRAEHIWHAFDNATEPLDFDWQALRDGLSDDFQEANEQVLALIGTHAKPFWHPHEGSTRSLTHSPFKAAMRQALSQLDTGPEVKAVAWRSAA